jgi:flagellar basal-body rod protein FlgC
MPTFSIFDIAGSGMSAQSVRLNTTASNLANADTVARDPNSVYRARHPVFQAVQAALDSTTDARAASATGGQSAVRVLGVVESTAPPVARYEPGNALADANGMVYSPNVNVVEEMVNMISASRAYQNDVEMMKSARDLMLATLRLGQ